MGEGKNAVAARALGVCKKIMRRNGSGVLTILILYVVIVSLCAPHITGGRFLTADNLLKILRQVTVLGVIACAATVVMLTGNIDLSVGSILSLTACVSASAVQYGAVPAIFAALGIGALCGLVNGFLIGKLKLNAFITSLGMLSVYQAAALLYTGNTYIVPQDNAAYKFIGQGYLFGFLPAPVVILAVVILIYHFVLKRTVYGARLYVIGANTACASFAGVNSGNHILAAYVLGGLTTGLAAVVMCSRVMSAQAMMGSGYEFDAVTAIVLGGTSILGGKGTIPGTLLGVIFLGVLSNGFVLMGIPTSYQWLIQGFILIIALRSDLVREKGVS